RAALASIHSLINPVRSRSRDRSRPIEELEQRFMMSTYTVTSTGDGFGTGTLRWAVGQTNSHNGGTINFDASIAGQTITLTSHANLEIASSLNTYVDGGTNNITIDGDNATNIFQVDQAGSATLHALRLTNGNSGGGDGGAIKSAGSLTVNNCDISYNHSGGNGGAIHQAYPGTLTVNHCTFNGDSAGGTGGAIDDQNGYYGCYGTSSVIISTSTFSGNVADGQGGAIFNEYGSTTVNLDIFNNNNAANGGGSIANLGSNTIGTNTTVNDCAFQENHVSVSGDGGGIANGIYTYTTVNNSTFTNNSASAGGAISDDFGSDGTSFVHVNNSILWNDGGGELEASSQSSSPGPAVVVQYSDVQGGVPSGALFS